jgi:hypothetical protein
MEAGSTSETPFNFYQSIRRNNPEDSHRHRLRVFDIRMLSGINGANGKKEIDRENC